MVRKWSFSMGAFPSRAGGGVVIFGGGIDTQDSTKAPGFFQTRQTVVSGGRSWRHGADIVDASSFFDTVTTVRGSMRNICCQRMVFDDGHKQILWWYFPKKARQHMLTDILLLECILTKSVVAGMRRRYLGAPPTCQKRLGNLRRQNAWQRSWTFATSNMRLMTFYELQEITNKE